MDKNIPLIKKYNPKTLDEFICNDILKTQLENFIQLKTIPNLIQEIQQNDNCLKDISYQNSKGQSRKINKTSLVNIVKFLMKK